MVKIIMHGCNGHMGQVITGIVANDANAQIVAGIDLRDDGHNSYPVFASLEEFGKGGDIVTDGEYDFVVIFNGRSFNLMFVKDNTFIKFNGWENLIKFTKKGIQK